MTQATDWLRNRRNALLALFAALMLPAAAAGLTACGDDAEDTIGCASDGECSFGQICGDDGACGTLPCTGNADCLDGNQACVEVGGDDVCAAVECGCIECDACPLGEVCTEGMCIDETAQTPCPNGDSDCSGSDVCGIDGNCRACAGDECPSEDCTTTGCPTGEVCNSVSGLCEVEDVATADACDACTTADECGTDWGCKPMITGNACLPPCTANDDCETGWGCQAGVCTPSNFKCTGCIIDGCPAGQACNTNTDSCIAAPGACGACGNDWECGQGNACHQGICVERCNDGACASGGACATSATQIEVCTEGCSETCDPVCTGATSVCSEGACVQCLTNGDCAGEATCDTANNTCQSTGECSGATPYYSDGVCVACLVNDHCGNDFCDQDTNTCSSDVCASCADPYPACVDYDGQFYCVQCEVDDDCGVGGTCNTTTYACEGGTVTPTEFCETDSDCVNSAQTSFNLACHTPTGYCYDTAGSCDDVTAFCVGTNDAIYECKSILDLVGFPGGLPDLGGAGSTIPGLCGCEYTWLPLWSSCQGGALCLDLNEADGLSEGTCLSFGQ